MNNRSCWDELTSLTQGRDFHVERVRLADSDVAIEGRFRPPALARLSPEDQVFVIAFVRSHGSIKQMEQFFGISYPTVKNRLRSIAAQLDLVEIDPPPPAGEVIDRLERGEISADEAAEQLGTGRE